MQPAAERPRRAAEFDGLFAGAVRGIERAEPTRLRLDLQPGPRTAARAAELAAAETGCCSFFRFIYGNILAIRPVSPGQAIAEGLTALSLCQVSP